MKFIVGLLILFFSHFVFAAEKCVERGNLAGTMVITKKTTIESLKKNPMSGPMAEVWRHMIYLGGDEYQKLGDDKEHIVATVKFIEKNNFSEDWRVDLLIFQEYFQSLCEQNLDILTAPQIDINALSTCFKENSKRDDKYKVCVRAQFAGKVK